MLELTALAQRLRGATHVVIGTHCAPDGDGIGCQLALLAVLEGLGGRVSVVSSGETPARFRFLPGAERFIDWDQLTPAAAEDLLRAADLALIVDTHEWALLGNLGAALQRASLPTLFLDHHPLTRPGDPAVHSDPQASSAGEVCHRLLGILGVPLGAQAATALYTAIAYDTNLFRHLRGRARTHEIAAELMRAGAATDLIYRHVFASHSAAKVQVLGEVLRSFTLAENGLLAWATLPPDLIARVGATRDELRDMIVPLLEIEGVEIALTFKRRDNGEYKVSLRSKGRVPVDGIAAELGGGGHRFAAGAHVPGPLAQATDRVLALARRALQAPPPDRPAQS